MDGGEPGRVLVTGAAGRIGRGVLAVLSERGVAANALVLEDPGDLPAELVVEGDARDPAAVRAALKGADGLVHLAAIPVPTGYAPELVFSLNTLSTFTVLEEAGRAGIGRACIASSFALTGLPFGRDLHPPYVPVDEDMPLQAEDAYALSKQADELTAAMMARRHGMSVVALRLPFVGGFEERLPEYAAIWSRDPGEGASTVWAYLETLDAARACVLGLSVPGPGAHAVYVAAPEILAPFPTEDLMRRYHPATELRRPMPGRATPIDTSAAHTLLGFTAERLLPMDERPLKRL
jgi:nucleoside-diphosphate-sugar epimerase